jgi:hypothetical protein
MLILSENKYFTVTVTATFYNTRHGVPMDQLYMVCISIFAIFVAVSSVVFVFLKLQLIGHGDSKLQKEKTVILLPFWAARPAALVRLTESKFRCKCGVAL